MATVQRSLGVKPERILTYTSKGQRWAWLSSAVSSLPESRALVCRALITPQVEEGAWRPLGPERRQCVWIYISGCHQLYVQGPPVPAAFPSPRFTVIFRLYRDTTVSRAALSACSLCWFPPAWHSGLTTDSARHLHLWKSNYITYNGFGRS